ncbi:DUF3455 domain-containing protein [Leptolyngbya sp. 7M]|uniref:DUF3455 domain-containing protein n=1 Tax=Leptolyngbya sp. 7M TaxID=2812896 RepID=UPI001B8BA0B1|nr:DUF3455 domain-containing protein [Leptolyngbya sp. 7M]QYO65664.1 DUF3455 domain-containing protein [Leptolyngbya sp. 7M]
MTSRIKWFGTAEAEGPGIFANVSHIQRFYTEGGLAPTEPGNVIGEERGIPYTAEYYFYRMRNTPGRPPIR